MAPGAPTPACMRWVRSAHVDLERDWEPFRLAEGLNAHLVSHPVAILGAERVAQDFDARHSASARHYLYRIVNRRAPLTLTRGRAWRLKPRLDAEAMHKAARALVGRHDFSTFRDAQCQAKSPIRTLDRLDVKRDGDEVLFETSALSFLHRQVRSMVGSLVDVGSGRWSASDLEAALKAADRSRCGQVGAGVRPLSRARRLLMGSALLWGERPSGRLFERVTSTTPRGHAQWCSTPPN